MRKFYILLAAVATLVLSAACSKVVTSAGGSGEQEVSFQVANYLHRTKANVAFDTGKTFTTYAWVYGTDSGDAFPLMHPATIGYKGGVWKATDRPYYWPKTGYLNFISHALTPESWIQGDQDNEEKTVPEVENVNGSIVVRYGIHASESNGQTVEEVNHVTIEEDADPLLAEAAFRYYWQRNPDEDWNEITDVKYDGKDLKGVPTLFHHLLSKVTIQVLFDAQDAEEGYNWNLLVNSASFNCANRGQLKVTFADPGITGTVWPLDEATDPFDPKGVFWIPELDEGGHALTVTKTLPEPIGSDYPAKASPKPIVLWNDISVLPQALFSGQAFSFNFTLTSTYNEGNPIVEIIDLPGIPFWNPQAEDEKIPGCFSNTINAWKMGHRYIYTITIKPNAGVKFDPAAVDWTVEEIDYPI